jgi:hypothetical protein
VLPRCTFHRKLNDLDARAWLADVLARIADHPAKRIADPAALELESRNTSCRYRCLNKIHNACDLGQMLTVPPSRLLLLQ